MIRVLLVLACLGLAEGRQPERTSPWTPPQSIVKRLEALSPDHPHAYFLLGEELADLGEDGPVELARALFVLAFELDRRRGGSGGLAASSCLALASLARLEQDRRWLTAMAGAIDPRHARQDWAVPAASSASEEVASKAATALGLVRAGDGAQARRILEDRGVMAVLRHYERALGTTLSTGALFRLQKYAAEWPCRVCDNRRVVPRQGPQGVDFRICPNCHGNPGPEMTEEEFVAHLRFEAALLSGIQRSWAAQFAVDQGAPLRDPDPTEMAATLGVDAGRPYWRAGAWAAGPGTTK